ncbi:unnamed protein product [Acanthoscelides obtectus]|uniref:Uncharacterized protein n=1 Tax=Acanthoscelides obtectus TaxID=200917 RepID=A0A9P0P015_ACAOB|nr:unnamed protein product [Acanthoscelides obtectus]CAK1669607.1 hypothetical protein AOBTE_LOCUS27102 [Acanthoscelides obtectus]
MFHPRPFVYSFQDPLADMEAGCSSWFDRSEDNVSTTWKIICLPNRSCRFARLSIRNNGSNEPDYPSWKGKIEIREPLILGDSYIYPRSDWQNWGQADSPEDGISESDVQQHGSRRSSSLSNRRSKRQILCEFKCRDNGIEHTNEDPAQTSANHHQ